MWFLYTLKLVCDLWPKVVALDQLDTRLMGRSQHWLRPIAFPVYFCLHPEAG